MNDWTKYYDYTCYYYVLLLGGRVLAVTSPATIGVSAGGGIH